VTDEATRPRRHGPDRGRIEEAMGIGVEEPLEDGRDRVQILRVIEDAIEAEQYAGPSKLIEALERN
jgi:hypothetical protein